MPVIALSHVTVHTARMAALIEFYRDVLGIVQGPRPAFDNHGAWLYCGDRPVVHLVSVEHAPAPCNNPALEHFAFDATGLAEFLASLKAQAIDCHISLVPGSQVVQVNIADPDGNHLHVDFASEERAGLTLETTSI